VDSASSSCRASISQVCRYYSAVAGQGVSVSPILNGIIQARQIVLAQRQAVQRGRPRAPLASVACGRGALLRCAATPCSVPANRARTCSTCKRSSRARGKTSGRTCNSTMAMRCCSIASRKRASSIFFLSRAHACAAASACWKECASTAWIRRASNSAKARSRACRSVSWRISAEIVPTGGAARESTRATSAGEGCEVGEGVSSPSEDPTYADEARPLAEMGVDEIETLPVATLRRNRDEAVEGFLKEPKDARSDKAYGDDPRIGDGLPFSLLCSGQVLRK